MEDHPDKLLIKDKIVRYIQFFSKSFKTNQELSEFFFTCLCNLSKNEKNKFYYYLTKLVFINSFRNEKCYIFYSKYVCNVKEYIKMFLVNNSNIYYVLPELCESFNEYNKDKSSFNNQLENISKVIKKKFEHIENNEIDYDFDTFLKRINMIEFQPRKLNNVFENIPKDCIFFRLLNKNLISHYDIREKKIGCDIFIAIKDIKCEKPSNNLFVLKNICQKKDGFITNLCFHNNNIFFVDNQNILYQFELNCLPNRNGKITKRTSDIQYYFVSDLCEVILTKNRNLTITYKGEKYKEVEDVFDIEVSETSIFYKKYDITKEKYKYITFVLTFNNNEIKCDIYESYRDNKLFNDGIKIHFIKNCEYYIKTKKKLKDLKSMVQSFSMKDQKLTDKSIKQCLIIIDVLKKNRTNNLYENIIFFSKFVEHYFSKDLNDVDIMDIYSDVDTTNISSETFENVKKRSIECVDTAILELKRYLHETYLNGWIWILTTGSEEKLILYNFITKEIFYNSIVKEYETSLYSDIYCKTLKNKLSLPDYMVYTKNSVFFIKDEKTIISLKSNITYHKFISDDKIILLQNV
uniref:Uncharacterized protein n=1 Tax=viral metagenome TaxID=1070528 RepID=A0A6C0JSH2_9ZZZZ